MRRFSVADLQRLIPSPGRIQSVLAHRAVHMAATLAALLWLSWGLSLGTWRMLQPSAPTVAGAGGAELGDLRALASTHPFGQAPLKAPAAEARVTVSNLAMTLTGVAMRALGGCALVVVQGQPESAFCAGEEISPGVRLDSVQRDRIVIVRGGTREAVLMKDAELTPGAAAPAPQQPLVQSSGDRQVVDRRQLQQQLGRPEFLGQAVIVPSPGGGFLVREMQPGSLYEKLGLRAGDVIRTVNGQPVSSMDDVMRLYQQFGSADRVQVEVQRGGRNESLYYDMR